MEITVGLGEGFVVGQYRTATGQGQVHTYTQGRMRLGQRDRVIESGHSGHERGRGEHAAQMTLNNAVVDSVGVTKVIRIQDQMFHILSPLFGLTLV